MNVSDMMSEFTDHGFGDESTTRQVAVINDTIYDICAREPWPFLEETVSTGSGLTLNTTTGAVTAPTDIKAVIAFVNTDTGGAINPVRYDVFTKTFASNLVKAANPQYYYFKSRSMFVYPQPSTQPNMTLRYLKLHPTLTSSSVEADLLLPKEHHRLVVLGALYKLYQMEDDPQMAQVFEEQYEKRFANMRNELWMRQYDRPDMIYVVDDDDYYETLF